MNNLYDIKKEVVNGNTQYYYHYRNKKFIFPIALQAMVAWDELAAGAKISDNKQIHFPIKFNVPSWDDLLKTKLVTHTKIKMMKKNFRTILLLITLLPSLLFAQVQPPECSEEGGDTIAPQFTPPYYLADSIYLNFESVPPLYNQAGTAVADLTFETMTDNCMMVYWPPCWCSATMSSGVLDQGEGWITYTFTAYDVSNNFNTQDITFYYEDIIDDISEQQEGDSCTIMQLFVYPNPSYGTFNVERAGKPCDYKVYDMARREVKPPYVGGAYLIISEGEVVKLWIIKEGENVRTWGR